VRGGRREALFEALSAYCVKSPRDDRAISRFRSFLDRADPFRRGDPDGHVTASAVVTRRSGGEFLLVFHRKLDRWLQPGGHVEPDDISVLAAAIREAREETGIDGFAAPLSDAILDLDVHSIPALSAEPAHVHYDVRFLLTTEDAGALAPGAAWFRFDAIPPLDRDGSLSRAVHKAVARLAAR
jgi:8-oxo-dGTP pyrophosphatase MutT (NUDIX family)